eukprot:TRINITY_DN1158_c2_g2_i1.p1 TRINITY_DN1158_c2_g2~~TRINITY_DN1158_c2_g2_i1.p1  ORF type:complete len:121 (+),score=11.84 TRINITY_DN1158_c2_g2_i1:57-365(+)
MRTWHHQPTWSQLRKSSAHETIVLRARPMITKVSRQTAAPLSLRLSPAPSDSALRLRLCWENNCSGAAGLKTIGIAASAAPGVSHASAACCEGFHERVVVAA